MKEMKEIKNSEFLNSETQINECMAINQNTAFTLKSRFYIIAENSV